MNNPRTCDVLVVGGGQAGIPLAYKLAAEGMSVALAERKDRGGAALTAEGAELVHTYIDLMNAGATLDVLQNAIHIHPTIAEDIQSAVS